MEQLTHVRFFMVFPEQLFLLPMSKVYCHEATLENSVMQESEMKISN